MNRKLTALLLAMTFAFSTVVPAAATAETGKTDSGKTASVEKSKEEKSKLSALLEKWRDTKEVKSTENSKESSKKTPLKASESEETESVSVKVAGDSEATAETIKGDKLFFSLQDIFGKELTGEKLKIKSTDGSFTEEVKSGEAIAASELKTGKYELTAEVPEGYTLVKSSVEFEISKDGKMKAEKGLLKEDDGKQVLVMTANFKDHITFFSLKSVLGKELPGAKLKITKKDGTFEKEWNSEDAPYGLNLSAGTYEFSQTVAPKGYKISKAVEFVVGEDGKIQEGTSGLKDGTNYQVLSLVNDLDKHGIKFRRVKSDGKELVGTAIEIYKGGAKVAFWKSGSEANKLELEPGTYRYHETGIPDGHKKVADFEFEVKADGTIRLGVVQVGDTVKLKDGTLVVSGNEAKVEPKEQKKVPESIWIELSLTKRSGGELSGAVVEIYQGSTMVESWTSTDLSFLTRLKPGTYRFHVKTAPTGFAAPKDFEFTVNQDGSVKLGTIPAGETVTVKGGLITVIFETQAAAAAIAGTTGQSGTTSNLPKTGDGISPVAYAAAIGVVGAVTLGIGMKKRKEEIDEAK